jgi:hypothetical protein
MRLLLSLLAFCALCQSSRAEQQDCKTITDPALRLTCYDKINPPVATYPIPLPKPSRPIPVPGADGNVAPADAQQYGDDAELRAKMNSICRGC